MKRHVPFHRDLTYRKGIIVIDAFGTKHGKTFMGFLHILELQGANITLKVEGSFS